MILFDARAQQDTHPTGVGIYSRHLALNILKTHIGNDVLFFQNSLKPLHTPLPKPQTITTNIPNKILNAAIAFGHFPTIQSLTNIDSSIPLFLPNINFATTRAPYILTVHDLSFKHFPHWYSPKMRWWHTIVQADKLIMNAQHIICVSHATATDVQRTYHIPEKRISVIYPGVCAPAATPYTQERPYLLAIGSIEPRKNQTALLHAFAHLIQHPQFSHFELKIVGPRGYQSKYFFSLIHTLGLRHHVTYLGYVSHAEKHSLIAGARIFVYPSLFEGFGFPPLEAMAHGTPVITSWSSSLKEVCGDHAILINPYNYSELADAMRMLLEDDKLQNHLSLEGKKYIKKYSWETCARQTADVLQHMM